MSRWLSSVNNLLEQLDGQVEEAVVDDLPTSRGALDHVLSSRGLQQQEDNESYEEDYDDDEDYSDFEEEGEWEEDDFDSEAEAEEEVIDLEAPSSGSAEPQVPLFSDDEPTPALVDETDVSNDVQAEPPSSDTEEPISQTVSAESESPGQSASPNDGPNDTDAPAAEAQPHNPDQSQGSPARSTDVSGVHDTQQQQDETSVPEASPKSAHMASPPVSEQFSVPSTTSMVPMLPTSSAPASGQISVASSSNNKQTEQLRRANQERKKAQAEARQLRKHVIALHSELESVEAEIKAQREELQRAAERMERDRNRHNEEREEMMDEHDDELESQKEEYERLMQEEKERHEEQVADLRQRLAQTEQMRMQEGGDWTKELEDAVKREQESLKKLGSVQDENSMLLSKVSKLETQQGALQNRLDTASQNAQNASQREREVEDKFDAALSLHSRQLSQRQAREAELERTVADLGAALVVARQKRSAPSSQPPTNTEGTESFKEQLAVALEELETVKVQLSMERQRSETLRSELEDVNKERTEEALATQARQQHYDRQVADLTAKVSRLQSSLRGIQRVEGDADGTGDSNDDVRTSRLVKELEESKNAVKTLSEQLIRQQNLVKSSKTENLALKNRLKAANDRAGNAEKALTATANVPSMYDVEAGGPGRLRRRIKGGRGKVASGSSVKSIRSALNMEPGRVGEGAEQVAATIDAIDSFMVETGSMFRHEPLARAAFFLYLVILHVWTFCLLIFHAHSFEPEHGDFGSLSVNGGVGQGPDAVVHHSYRQMEQMGHP